MDKAKRQQLETFIEYPEETASVEYKSALPFDIETDFGLKLIRHILGHANAGGGYLVVGFTEMPDRALRPDEGLIAEMAGTYETTKICQAVDKFLRGQKINIQVHKIPSGEKMYPIISVEGFNDVPYFCARDAWDKKQKTLILKEGALYIRDGAAKTVVIADQHHWNTLLTKAIRFRQSEFMDQVRSLVSELGLSIPVAKESPKTNAPLGFVEWLEVERNEAAEKRRQHGMEEAGYLEVFHFPRNDEGNWDHPRLLEAAERSACRNTGWPMGVVMRNPTMSPKPFPMGIRAIMYAETFTRSLDVWSLSKKGWFYLMRVLDEDLELEGGPYLWFDGSIWRVAEALLHCSNLYNYLGLEPSGIIKISIAHNLLRERTLSAMTARMMLPRKAVAANPIWHKEVVLGSIPGALEELVRDVLGDLFTLFEFWQPSDSVWSSVLKNFLDSRT